jgi:hypothetical protein
MVGSFLCTDIVKVHNFFVVRAACPVCADRIAIWILNGFSKRLACPIISFRLCRIQILREEVKIVEGTNILGGTRTMSQKKRRRASLQSGIPASRGPKAGLSTTPYTSRRLEMYVKSQSSLQGYTTVHQVPRYI